MFDFHDNTVAEIQFSYKPHRPSAELAKIQSSANAYELIKPHFSDCLEYFESFKILFLNHACKVLGFNTISNGGLSSTIVDIRIVLSRTLAVNACSIILIHNHPSGTLKPSEQDKQLTAKIVKAAETLDLKILDHLIITNDSYFSFADEGML